MNSVCAIYSVGARKQKKRVAVCFRNAYLTRVHWFSLLAPILTDDAGFRSRQ